MSSKSYRNVPCTGTVSSVSDALSALEELGGECREIVDNAPPGLADTQRIQTFSESADALEALFDPGAPDCVADLPISYSEAVWTRKRGGASRAARRSNATAVLMAAAEAMQTWLDDEANAEHDDRDEVESYVTELEDLAGQADDCEFPGMFG